LFGGTHRASLRWNDGGGGSSLGKAAFRIGVVVVVQPRVVSPGRQMMKEEGLVDVFGWGSVAVAVDTGRCCGGEGPVGDRHAVVGKARRAHIDAMGGDCGRSRSSRSIRSRGGGRIRSACRVVVVVVGGGGRCFASSCLVGIIGVIDGGPGPMGRGGRLGLVPVARDVLCVGIVVGVGVDVCRNRSRIGITITISVDISVTVHIGIGISFHRCPDIVQDASKTTLLQNGRHPVIKRDAPEVGACRDPLPFGRCVVLASLLVKVALDEDWHGIGIVVTAVVSTVVVTSIVVVRTGVGLLEKIVDFRSPSFRIKGIEMGPDDPAAALVVRLQEQAEGGAIGREDELFETEDFVAGRDHGGGVPVAGHSRKMIAPQPQDFFEKGLEGSDGPGLLCAVIDSIGSSSSIGSVIGIVGVAILHFPPVYLIEDENVGIGLTDGTDDPCRDGVQVAFVLG